ncbi:MAG TPA: efflux RND transporter periplasmic adaptor subunit [Candidatus Krumholzibacteria bacterium]|nr:efflux RND transporter periplasmic adaptor subunit [Candidatus Krumholzibacteria bacterium]HPD73222.1 efflux RND transporter periplasmic adaptor subunit [Candidatus Krumholzibacteria bacterium]HRY40184.1 efflux RND transporter periplasmic adaptor subunit [Candidatus Krumholzibacteria bacterium]
MKTMQLAMWGLVGLLALAGCGREAEGTAAGRSSGRPAVAVEVVTATPDSLVETVPVVGSLAPKRQADVRSEVSGTVTEVPVTEWVAVERGEVLARIDPRETEASLALAKAELARAEAGEARAARELDRGERLRAAGLATQQNLDDARTEREAAAAVTAAARAQLDYARSRSDKAVLRAPIDGVVAYRGVNVGDYVETMGAPPLFRIVDNRLLDLTVTVPASRSSRLAVGQNVQFTTEAVPDQIFTGKVAHINPTIDETSRTLQLIAEVANAGGALRGGLFVSGQVEVGVRRGVLRVPLVALQGWNVAAGRADVFVVADSVARRRPVEVGVVVDGLVEVTAGLRAGDRVVTRGAFNLRDGDRVTIAGGTED